MDWSSAQRMPVCSTPTAAAMKRATSGQPRQGARQAYSSPWSPPQPYMQTNGPAWAPLPHLNPSLNSTSPYAQYLQAVDTRSPSRATDQLSLSSPASDFSQVLDFGDVTGAHSPYDLLEPAFSNSAGADTINNVLTDVVASTNKRKRRRDSQNERQAVSAEFRTRVKKDAKGNVQHVFRAGGVKRAKLLPQAKSSTELTRKFGSCERCRRQKIRCNSSGNEYDTCETCAALPWHRLHQPCARIDILNLNMHRIGSTANDDLKNWMKEKDLFKDIKLLDNGEIVYEPPKKIRITQRVGPTLEVTLSKFVPSLDDVVSYPWKDSSGQEHILEMPPYYISDMDEAKRNVVQYLRNTTKYYLTSLLSGANPVIRETFKQACEYIRDKKSSLIFTVLQFWVCTRLTEIVWTICNAEDIGLGPPNDPESPWYNTLPVTPIMDTQLDELVIRDVLIPLRDKLLKQLKEKILERKKENFLEIYFATFITMNNFEFIFADVIDYTTRHGMTTGSGGPSLCEGYVHACKAMLSYFHFSSDGAIPFSLDWGEQDLPSYITQEQARFIRRIQKEIGNQQHSLKDWQTASMYKRPMYWCYQMFVNDWSGDISPACEILPFTEKDFLTS